MARVLIVDDEAPARRYLRRLLEADPARPRYLQTVWGVGYVFVPDGENGDKSEGSTQ